MFDQVCVVRLQNPWLLRPSQGLGELGNKAIYFIGAREQKSKTKENMGTKAILENREHRKSRFWFWGTRENDDFFQGNKGTGILWEGLTTIPRTEYISVDCINV